MSEKKDEIIYVIGDIKIQLFPNIIENFNKIVNLWRVGSTGHLSVIPFGL